MPDWKRKIDQYISRKALMDAHSSNSTIWLPSEDKVTKSNVGPGFVDKLVNDLHKKLFQCHIKNCSIVSTGPYYEEGEHSVWYGESSEHFISKPGKYHVLQPTGLEKCKLCGKWTCTEFHLYRGICQECSERLEL